MTTAYSYIRFSTPAQLKGDSLRRQLAKAERFAVDHGLILDTSHCDLGRSAFTGQHRTKGALANFLAMVRAGEIARNSWLIVENIDRLSRENTWDALGLFREIIEAGLTVASLIDDMIYDLASLRNRPEMMVTLNAALTKAHRESADKADRLQEVWAEKRAGIEGGGRRKLTRQGPSWLDLTADDPREPLVGEWRLNDRAKIVRQIYDWALAGIGKETIAQRLNQARTKPFRHGDGWNASVVAVLLKDRRTIGELQLYTKVDGTRRPTGDPIADYFPAAIPEDIFYRTQAAIKSRWCGASASRKITVPNLLVGLARCQCGRVMEFRDRRSKRNNHPRAVYLTCSGNRRGHACVNNARFTYRHTEAAILEWVTDIEISDFDASEANIAALKLMAKEAERDDLQRRISESIEKWSTETVPLIKDQLYAMAQRDARLLEKVKDEAKTLATVATINKRSILEDRRAEARRIANRLATLKGDALFEARAKLAAALRAVIDRIEFHQDATYGVTTKNGLKLYTFEGGELIRAFDLAKVNEGQKDKLLTFPQGADIDRQNLAPMTVSGIRETLVGLLNN